MAMSEVKKMRENKGIHEKLELHELLTFKSLCLTKAATMQALISDPQLKEIMKQDVNMHSKHIPELQHHLS